MNIFDIRKLINPIKKKLMLIIGRCILSAVSESGNNQKLKVTGLKNEKLSEVDRPQNYGLETSPPLSDTEVITASIGGNRENTIAIIVNNPDSRPIGLSEGDVVLYDKNTNTITLNVAGIEIKDKNGNEIVMDNTSGINIKDKNGNELVLSATGIQLKTGDSTLWAPCIVPNCLFSGAPHGGVPAGIVKLKGG